MSGLSAALPEGGSELRALRRLSEAQAHEIAQLREQVHAFRLLHDDDGEAQLLELDEVRRELLELRDIVWPEVLDLRARRAEGEAEVTRLRAELEALQPIALAADGARAQLANALSENGELKARCNALVVELERAVEHAERTEARLRELDGDGEREGVLAQLLAARESEARERERGESLAHELAEARASIAALSASVSTLSAAAAAAKSAASHATSLRRLAREAEERARGGQALSSAAEAARRWASMSGALERSPYTDRRARRSSTPASDDGSEGAQLGAAASLRARTEKLAADEALSAKLRLLHASFREAAPTRGAGR